MIFFISWFYKPFRKVWAEGKNHQTRLIKLSSTIVLKLLFISNSLDHFLLWFGVSPLSRLLTALMRAAAATTQKRTQKGVRTTECLFPSFHNLTCRMERLRGKFFKYSRWFLRFLSFGHTHSIVDPKLIFSIRFTKPLYWWEKGGRDCGGLRRFGESDTKDQVRINNWVCVAEA